MNPKRILLLVVALLGFTGCATRIGPGNVGIKVDLAGTQRGVEDLPIRTGWVFYSPFSSTIVEYPTFVQTAKWTKSPNEGDNPESGDKANEEISFNDSNGLTVNADISISYQLRADKIPAFYVKFRNDDIRGFTHGFLRNVTRDCFNDEGGHYRVEDIMGIKKEEFVKAVWSKVAERTADIGVNIVQLGFIESPRPPQSIIDSINAKVQATQYAIQKQNELVQVEADAKKLVAKTQGEADANRVLTSSISPQLIEWQRMRLQYEQLAVTDRWINRWNGQMPSVNSKDPVGMLLDIRPEAK